jgi:hypothetical protein
MNCEHIFDNMLNYSRPIEEFYEYRNAIKNGNFEEISNVTAKAVEREYGVDLSYWDKLIRGELDKESTTVTAKPQYTEPVVDETVVLTQQTTDTGIVGIVKKAWNFASGLFGKKTAVPPALEQLKEPQVKEEPKPRMADTEPKPVQPVTTEERKENTSLSIYMSDGKFTMVMTKGETFKSAYIDLLMHTG